MPGKAPRFAKHRGAQPSKPPREHFSDVIYIPYLDNLEISQHCKNAVFVSVYAALRCFGVYSDLYSCTAEFEELKEYNNKIYHLLNDDFLLSDVADKIYNCGDFLGFALNGADGYSLVTANFCRQKLCPMCQKRKSLKAYANTLKVYEYLQRYNVEYIHLVLTVPNCSGGVDLVNTVKRLYKSFGKFYNYKDCKAAFKGCLRCLEISYNYENGTFHPHLHCLICVNASYFSSRYYLSYDRLRDLWAKANNTDEAYQISVGKIKGDVKLGFAEICKYCFKPLDFSLIDDTTAKYILETMGIVLKGQRCVQKYGLIKEAFHHLNIDNIEDDTEEIKQMFDTPKYFRYNKIKREYRGLN